MNAAAGIELLRMVSRPLKILVWFGRLPLKVFGWFGRLRPPGSRTAHLLSLLFGRRAAERIFAQTIADAREEWVEAAARGDERKQRAIRWRTPLVLVFAAVAFVLAKFASPITNALKIGKGVGELGPGDDDAEH